MNTVHLDADCVRLLRQFADMPLSERLCAGAVPDRLTELQAAGYAKVIPIGISQALIEITDGGRQALAAFEKSAAGGRAQRPH